MSSRNGNIGDRYTCMSCGGIIFIVDFEEAEGDALWSHETGDCDDPVPGGRELHREEFYNKLLSISRRDKIESYLDSLHSTTWGRGFDIIGKETREQAIQFIQTLIERVEEQ